MLSKNILTFVLIYCVSNVHSWVQTRTPCGIEDYRCTTVASNPVYQVVVKGIPEIGLPTSEPLYQDVIHGFVPNMNYTLTNAYMYGMTDCFIKHHRIYIKELTWTFTLHCPRLTLKSNYEVIGYIGGNYIEGKGPCQITDDQYHMVVRGGFEFLKGDDGKPRFKITHFDFDELEVLGKVKYELHNLYNGDEVKSAKMHKFLNENWKHVSDTTHYPTLYAFMGKLLDNLNIFLFAVPAEEIFYRT